MLLETLNLAEDSMSSPERMALNRIRTEIAALNPQFNDHNVNYAGAIVMKVGALRSVLSRLGDEHPHLAGRLEQEGMRLEAEAQKSSDYVMYHEDMKYKIQAAHVMAVGKQSPSCIYDERDYVTNAKRLENNTIEETMKLQHQTGVAMAPNILELRDKSSGSLSKNYERKQQAQKKLESLLDYKNKSSTLNIEQEEELRFRRLRGEYN